MKPAVVYLARDVNPPRFARAFLQSLVQYRSGGPYDLAVLLKGQKQQAHNRMLDRFERQFTGKVIRLPISDEIFATNAFFEAARLLPHERLLFFVSWSRILTSDWLVPYHAAFASDARCALVGASGGYEALDETTPFPNVNVRTTAFMVDRKTFLALDPGDLSTKRGGNLFEAGPNSMTRQIERSGRSFLLVDREGRAYSPAEWPASRTFRSGNQEGLIVADNRTHHYAVGSRRKRLKLARLNWGSEASVAPASPLSRAFRQITWTLQGRFPRHGI